MIKLIDITRTNGLIVPAHKQADIILTATMYEEYNGQQCELRGIDPEAYIDDNRGI
jgi:hypothetical protein